MKFFFNIQILVFTLLSLALLVSCADVETETSGYASLKISLDDVSHKKESFSKHSNSKMAPSMTSSDAETILAVLMPAVKCESSSAFSASEYDRALVDITTKQAKFVIPLDTQVKLCLYFYRETFSINELGSGTNAAEGFGESGIFTVDSETNTKTILVEFWTTSYSTVTFKVSSVSSAGLLEGATGIANLNSTSGKLLDNQSFSITSDDNSSKSLIFSDIAYNSYTYDVELLGFIPASETFLVSSATETLDIKLTPNYVDIDWLSFDNMTINQVDTSAYATVSGSLVLDVPFDLKDNVTQIVSLMQVRRELSSTIVDVTPPVPLSTWLESERIDNVTYDNVTYTYQFSAGSNMPLVHGTNRFQITLSVNDESRTETIGEIDYDACVDNSTMCFSLSWGEGQDLDLHSYYFPDWSYNEHLTNGSIDNTSDNTSRGYRHWVYSNDANKTFSGTGETIQLKDFSGDNGTEVQVWATDSQKVGDGTYLVYVEDLGEVDVQNFKISMAGPGITDNITYGPYNFKNDSNSSTTEAVNPQAVFFVQVENNTIMRSDNFSVGDNLSSELMHWTGPLQNSDTSL